MEQGSKAPILLETTSVYAGDCNEAPRRPIQFGYGFTRNL
jgi:hypothetical protein